MSTDDDDEWFEATCIGDEYQSQISRRGRWRHRPLNFRHDPRDFTSELGVGSWLEGPPPKKG